MRVEDLLAVKGDSPLGWALAPLVPLSHLYGLGMRARRKLYAEGLFGRRTLPARVISIGNLTVGGTGKTPVVIALANALKQSGRRVGIISRGYGRRGSAPLLEVSDGHAVRCDPTQSGDEPCLIAKRCPGVPVAVGANRYQVGRHLLDRFGVDTIVMDDGFQHLAVRRDLDILVLDATAPFGNGYLLPRGGLREPLSAMARASLGLLTRARQAVSLDDVVSEIRRLAPSLPLAITDFRLDVLVKVGSDLTLDPSVLRGERVVAVSGIGNPESFRRLLEAQGTTLLEHYNFPDHYRYGREDIQRVTETAKRLMADRIITTEKDAVKLESFKTIGASPALHGIWAARIGLEWLEGYEQWAGIISAS